MEKAAENNQEYYLKIFKIRYPKYLEILQKYQLQGKLLDIGSGFAGVWFNDYIKHTNFEYFCSDLSDDVIAYMTNLLEIQGTETYVKKGILENLPWNENFFDVIYVAHILEHSTDIDKAFSEIKRVLKPSGFLLFAVPCGYDDEPAHLHNREYEEWLEDFKNNNMEILESGRFDFNLNEFYGLARPIS